MKNSKNHSALLRNPETSERSEVMLKHQSMRKASVSVNKKVSLEIMYAGLVELHSKIPKGRDIPLTITSQICKEEDRFFAMPTQTIGELSLKAKYAKKYSDPSLWAEYFVFDIEHIFKAKSKAEAGLMRLVGKMFASRERVTRAENAIVQQRIKDICEAFAA
jgi:hypothetical protein